MLALGGADDRQLICESDIVPGGKAVGVLSSRSKLQRILSSGDGAGLSRRVTCRVYRAGPGPMPAARRCRPGGPPVREGRARPSGRVRARTRYTLPALLGPAAGTRQGAGVGLGAVHKCPASHIQ